MGFQHLNQSNKSACKSRKHGFRDTPVSFHELQDSPNKHKDKYQEIAVNGYLHNTVVDTNQGKLKIIDIQNSLGTIECYNHNNESQVLNPPKLQGSPNHYICINIKDETLKTTPTTPLMFKFNMKNKNHSVAVEDKIYSRNNPGVLQRQKKAGLQKLLGYEYTTERFNNIDLLGKIAEAWSEFKGSYFFTTRYDKLIWLMLDSYVNGNYAGDLDKVAKEAYFSVFDEFFNSITVPIEYNFDEYSYMIRWHIDTRVSKQFRKKTEIIKIFTDKLKLLFNDINTNELSHEIKEFEYIISAIYFRNTRKIQNFSIRCYSLITCEVLRNLLDDDDNFKKIDPYFIKPNEIIKLSINEYEALTLSLKGDLKLFRAPKRKMIPKHDRSKELQVDPLFYGCWLANGVVNTPSIFSIDDYTNTFLERLVMEADLVDENISYFLRQEACMGIITNSITNSISTTNPFIGMEKELSKYYFHVNEDIKLEILGGFITANGYYNSGNNIYYLSKAAIQINLLKDLKSIADSIGLITSPIKKLNKLFVLNIVGELRLSRKVITPFKRMCKIKNIDKSTLRLKYHHILINDNSEYFAKNLAKYSDCEVLSESLGDVYQLNVASTCQTASGVLI